MTDGFRRLSKTNATHAGGSTDGEVFWRVVKGNLKRAVLAGVVFVLLFCATILLYKIAGQSLPAGGAEGTVIQFILLLIITALTLLILSRLGIREILRNAEESKSDDQPVNKNKESERRD